MREIRSFSLALILVILTAVVADAQRDPQITITVNNGVFTIAAVVGTEAERAQLLSILERNLVNKVSPESVKVSDQVTILPGGWQFAFETDLKRIGSWKNGVYRWGRDDSKLKNAFAKYLGSVQVSEIGKPGKTKLIDPTKKLTLVELMATWAGPARVEQVEFQELYKKYADIGLDVVAVTVDEADTLIRLKDFSDQYGSTFRFAIPPDDFTAKAVQFTQFPGIPVCL